MTWHSVPVAMMLAVTAYAAVLFFGLHTAVRGKSRRENLTFALMCLAVAAYDAACVALYNASSVPEGIGWQRVQFAAAALIGVAYIVFTWDFIGARMPRTTRIFTWFLALLVPLPLLVDHPLALSASVVKEKHVAFAGLVITYHEAHPGPICDAIMVTSIFAYLHTGGSLARYFLRTRRAGALAFMVALVVSFATAVNDCAVASALWSAPYAFEYGIGAIVMAMGYAMLLRFRDLHEEIEALNVGLAHTNADLQVALAQAQEGSRAKTEFLASISHELRTPLNAIINLPEGVLEEFEGRAVARCAACDAAFELEAEDEIAEAACPACAAKGSLGVREEWTFDGDAQIARRHLQRVTQAGRHLLGLVKDVLDASKLELGRTALELAPLDVGDLVGEVVDAVRPTAAGGAIALETDAPAGLAVAADRVKLAQVLYNLVGNAIKFSPAGSAVRVTARTHEPAQVLISVRDDGIGIAPEHREVVFEKFRQVDAGATRAYGGTGLGLAISKSIVELHGGRIWVESEVGKGSTFHVLLPRQAGTLVEAAR